MGRITGVVLALVLAVVMTPTGVVGAGAPVARVEAHPPILLVHGYDDSVGDCPGRNVSRFWAKTAAALTRRLSMPASDVLAVSYYKCDTRGVDITGSKRGTDFPTTPTAGSGVPRVGYTTQTSIVRLARDLAWFIRNEFSQHGQTVDVLGHSMGGLIIREALRRVQAGARGFPRRILVRKVLAVSTPHLGRTVTCARNRQCRQMSPGSSFVNQLQRNPAPHGAGGTKWFAMATRGSLIGGVPCDGILTDSATAVGGVDLIYTRPCYGHKGYLYDDSNRLNAAGSARIRGRHSLAMAAAALG